MLPFVIAVAVLCRIQDTDTLLSEFMVHRKDPVQDPLHHKNTLTMQLISFQQKVTLYQKSNKVVALTSFFF